MDKRLEEFSTIKLHYKNGKVTVAFCFEETGEIFHSYTKVVSGLNEVFALYKTYISFINEKGWHLIAAHLAGMYGISIEGKSVGQVAKEVHITQQKLLKEMGEI